MGLIDGLIRGTMPLLPRSLVWLVARRYVAGADLGDALRRIASLRGQGFGTILDVLGEGVSDRVGAREAAAEYGRALSLLEGLDTDCPISLKPTHLGLLLDRDLCRGLLDDLCAQAASVGRRVRFEMEDAPTIDATLDVFGSLRARHPNLGCVIQSRLFRSAEDVMHLLEQGDALDVRLVKGIYLEPASIAWTEAADISRSYLDLARTLWQGGARVALATHDRTLADACLGLLGELGLSDLAGAARRHEFQLLMGVRRDQAARLLRAGQPVSIYVPYGRDWHAYSMRRLQRNPEIARQVLAAFLRRG